MQKHIKTPLIIFLTFIVTSAMYLVAFIFVPAFSAGIADIQSLFSLQKSNKNSSLSSRISEIDSHINSSYIHDYKQDELDDLALKGYVAGLKDVYSQYYTKEEFDELNSQVNGNYKGVGIEVTVDEDNLITVLNAYKDAPAAKAGICSGDKIIAVDGVSVNRNNYDQALSMIKGAGKYSGKSDKVTLTILRGEDKFDTVVTREAITMQSVSEELIEGNIGYIELSAFAEDSDEQFKKAVNSLVSKGASSLIIDLRNNGGGLLTTVVSISDYLLPEGKILTIKGKNSQPQVFSSDSKCIDIPMCVLINGNSASASEVLAGALKDHKKATLVGETTYGKGVVQTMYNLSGGCGLKLTTSEYYTPNNICIDKIGIKPDIEVPMELTKNLSLYTLEEDIQLKEAINQLK